KTIFSHQETGNAITYQRDKDVAAFCSRHQIEWKEYPTNGVVRRLYHRNNFNKRWFETMSAVEFDVDVEKIQSVQLPAGLLPPYAIVHPTNKNFQPGGVSAAKKYLYSFLYERKTNYSKHISKPQESRTGCSRLSPYLAWGNLSMKQVYQATLQAIGETGDTRNLNFFVARLHWHCHFIQKFETECRMEFENLNRGFDSIRKEIDPQLITAWEQGKTGYPLVDACMRCVVETGYLNFRMRSMIVSFLTHHLWQPWQAGAHFLAKHFLDYEPGIHYPQLQMQADTMGVNTIRIYNPVKQSQEHDPEGLFIKKWVAALKHVPTKHIHEPWKMTVLEQQMCNVILGVDYPTPIIDMEEKSRYARNQLWNNKNSVTTQRENLQILKKHTKRKTVEEQPTKRKRGVTNKSVSK
ncbi:MAG: deoxyribodipyrimidine photo-lyase/cryptochrome family protein, partial [Flammeovirgaceae bacterium]